MIITQERITKYGVVLLLILVAFSGNAAGLTDKEGLGKLIYEDTSLSSPVGMSCASCHLSSAGFADPNSNLPVSQGVIPTRYGSRNAPTAAYAAYSPDFSLDESAGIAIGGQFWDGRAIDLVAQAKGPFLNPVEMHNKDANIVVTRVKNSRYSATFKEIYGQDAFNNVDTAYNYIADAIAAYEESSEVNRFSSDYDNYIGGTGTLSKSELKGLELFEMNCISCHSSAPDGKQLFTDYGYRNIGVPSNPNNPYYYIARVFNPDGAAYVDLGLGGRTDINNPELYGKMKTPTLRNIADTSPYMHNGMFNTLPEVVTFLNDRQGYYDSTGYSPEVDTDINQTVGNLNLEQEDINAIVEFLNTLSDE